MLIKCVKLFKNRNTNKGSPVTVNTVPPSQGQIVPEFPLVKIGLSGESAEARIRTTSYCLSSHDRQKKIDPFPKFEFLRPVEYNLPSLFCV